MKKFTSFLIFVLCAACLAAGTSFGYSRDINAGLSYEGMKISVSYSGESSTGKSTQLTMNLGYSEYFSENGSIGAFVEFSPLYRALSSESDGVSIDVDSDIHNFTDTFIMNFGISGRFSINRTFRLFANAGMHYESATESGISLSVIGVVGKIGVLAGLTDNFAFRLGGSVVLPVSYTMKHSGVSVKIDVSGLMYGITAGCAVLL